MLLRVVSGLSGVCISGIRWKFSSFEIYEEREVASQEFREICGAILRRNRWAACRPAKVPNPAIPSELCQKPPTIQTNKKQIVAISSDAHCNSRHQLIEFLFRQLLAECVQIVQVLRNQRNQQQAEYQDKALPQSRQNNTSSKPKSTKAIADRCIDITPWIRRMNSP